MSPLSDQSPGGLARRAKGWGRLLLCLVAACWALRAGSAEAETGGPAPVLVIYSQGRLLPANVQIDAGLNARDGPPGSGSEIRLFAEFLGDPEFAGKEYEAQVAAFLHHKYAARPPRVVVVAGYVALGFMLRHREAMFPGVPIVFTGVDLNYLPKMGPLPTGVTGIPVGYDVGGTIDLAVRLHPDARRLVIVNGAGDWAQVREGEARQALAQRALPMPVEYLSGLSTPALLDRLRALPADSIVFSQGYFLDGAGIASTPLESIQQMLKAAPAPIYTVYASQLGSGVVGGRMSSFTEMGRQTRRVVEEILLGQPDAVSRGVRPALAAPAQLDWRALQRWGVPLDRVPADAEVHFRQPGLWEAYRSQALVAALVLLAQTGLIAALLVERRRRRHTARALADSERQVSVAAKAARLSTFDWHVDAGGGLDGAARARLPQSLIEAIHPDDRERLMQAAQAAIDQAVELDVELRTLGPEGVRWTALRGHAVDGDRPRITGVSMDISERKSAELQAASDRAALTHLSRVATMGQLSAALAHQLNQPLASILANAETARKLLDRNASGTEDLKEILDDIAAEDCRAADIIRHLAALYRGGASERTRFDLNALVNETLALLRAELTFRHTAKRRELAAALPQIEGSRIELQQVILNLVINAADAMMARPEGQRTVTVRTLRDGDHVRVEVVDQGHGLSPEASAHLFDPFWTTKSHGLGVGLAICRTIIEAHDGTIGAANNAGAGATFWFMLPAAPDTET